MSADLERACLGAMILDGDAAEMGLGVLRPEDFFYGSNKDIFLAMSALYDRGSALDVVLIFEELQRQKAAERVGLEYLKKVCVSGTSLNMRQYVEELRHNSFLRRCGAMGRELAEAAAALDDTKVYDVLDRLERDKEEKSGLLDGAAIFEEHLKGLIRRRKEGNIQGISTGFVDLDAYLGGLREGELYILAARPSMGKTALALDLARSVAKKSEKKKVVVFSLEMAKEQLVSRIYSGEYKADNAIFSIKEKDEKNWEKFLANLEEHGAELDRMLGRILIDDRSYCRVQDMRMLCHGVKSGIALVVVDYIQLMQGTGENRTQEISGISRGLKLMAKEFQCPVVALSQLSRKVEERADKRPMLSDLRESGAIEQDADSVLFLYRDEYYFPDSEKKNLAEVIIAKQRNGPTGTVDLAWIPESTTFRSRERWTPTSKKSPWEEAQEK